MIVVLERLGQPLAIPVHGKITAAGPKDYRLGNVWAKEEDESMATLF